ncbi:MAG: carboxymuconolactone decarboxylase family protein [Acidimicrobiia bacterium]
MYAQRMAPLRSDEVDDETRQLFDKGLRGPDGTPLNIFATLARHPKLLKRWLPFATHVLSKNSLSPRHRELLILRTGYRCRSTYEWGQHVLIALDCDLTQDEVDRVRQGPDAGWDEHESALLRAADELHDESLISDRTWMQLAARYGDEELIDVIATVGNYHVVAFLLNSLGVQLDEGVPDSL